VTPDALVLIERAGRTCYKSEDKITERSSEDFVRMIIGRGHHSVLEHASMTVRIVCDRGVTHEIVRHRLCAYSQESTRYCDYVGRDTDGEHGVKFITPFFFDPMEERKEIYVPSVRIEPDEDSPGRHAELSFGIDKFLANSFDVWMTSCLFSEWAYNVMMKEFGRTPQEARSVLPNSLKTEIVVTANVREWRHIFSLRVSKAAHPQMREVMIRVLEKAKEAIPVVFEDINP
jgi:thymidylate synthase (FAD)